MSGLHEAAAPVRVLREIHSGEWGTWPNMGEYRAEWLSGLLVERATWQGDAPAQALDGVQVVGSGYVWFRFWLPKPRQIVEKYFDADGRALGIYLPVSDSVRLSDQQYSTHHLWLGLWLLPSDHLTVLGEAAFEAAIDAQTLSPSQVEWAETRVRELTREVSRKQMPPAMIRNFAIEKR